MHVEDFAGRGASVKGLCEGYLDGAPAHAALLVGPAGVGKRTLAGLLAQTLYCTGAAPKPCGECPGCRKLVAGSHPDAYLIPEQKKIGVDDIRSLIESLHVSAYEGGWRTVRIEGAGAMTVQAQNSLLKTLEEPPKKTAFLLTATSAAQLLPTILSRCQMVRLSPLSTQDVAKALQGRGIDAARAEELARMSEGSIGAALAMDADASYWALRRKVDDALGQVQKPADVWQAMQAFKDDKADAGRICDILEQQIRGLMRSSTQAPAASWQARAASLPVQALAEGLQHVMTMRKMLASNVAWPSVWERFLFQYSEDIQSWQS